MGLITVQPISEPFNLNFGDTGGLSSPHKIDTDTSSPIQQKKPYSDGRSRVTFTMEDLEHSESDDDQVFEKIIKPSISSRSQPKRSCKIGQNLAFSHCADENSSYQDHCEKESTQILDSGSNSDWYEY